MRAEVDDVPEAVDGELSVQKFGDGEDVDAFL
jgi:hypothetical protein